ncbi:hypothetical protein TNCV_4717531 [Trichonephila clavipes]|nr:hypothetical protein TNCV_4717531 [Trichonephila clavipes]
MHAYTVVSDKIPKSPTDFKRATQNVVNVNDENVTPLPDYTTECLCLPIIVPKGLLSVAIFNYEALNSNVTYASCYVT